MYRKYGAADEGYPSIVGAGENGCVLHYIENDKEEIHNQLVLMDLGAEYYGYTADVTRTIPANGVFSPELSNFGKPEGYVKRQVEGWAYRYEKSKTNNFHGIEKTIKWLCNNYPTEHETSLIHNDYKYDNLVLSGDDNLKIKAVLDWEMADRKSVV